MPLKEEDWEVVKGRYRTPDVCPWCGGKIEEKLLEVKFLEGKVRVSKFPKMVCSKCGRSFMNDEQAAYYELGDGEGAVGERGGKAIRGYLMKNENCKVKIVFV